MQNNLHFTNVLSDNMEIYQTSKVRTFKDEILFTSDVVTVAILLLPKLLSESHAGSRFSLWPLLKVLIKSESL